MHTIRVQILKYFWRINRTSLPFISFSFFFSEVNSVSIRANTFFQRISSLKAFRCHFAECGNFSQHFSMHDVMTHELAHESLNRYEFRHQAKSLLNNEKPCFITSKIWRMLIFYIRLCHLNFSWARERKNAYGWKLMANKGGNI